MRFAALVLTALLVITSSFVNRASAVTGQEALEWLVGRWSNSKNNCSSGWESFQRRGAAWTYQSARLAGGKIWPATATATPNGVVTFKVDMGDGDVYQYVNTMKSKNSFEAVEGPVVNGKALKPISLTYTRC